MEIIENMRERPSLIHATAARTAFSEHAALRRTQAADARPAGDATDRLRLRQVDRLPETASAGRELAR